VQKKLKITCSNVQTLFASTLPGCKFAVCWRLPLPALKFMAKNGSGNQDLGYFMMRITRSQRAPPPGCHGPHIIYFQAKSINGNKFLSLDAIIEKIASPNL